MHNHSLLEGVSVFWTICAINPYYWKMPRSSSSEADIINGEPTERDDKGKEDTLLTRCSFYLVSLLLHMITVPCWLLGLPSSDVRLFPPKQQRAVLSLSLNHTWVKRVTSYRRAREKGIFFSLNFYLFECFISCEVEFLYQINMMYFHMNWYFSGDAKTMAYSVCNISVISQNYFFIRFNALIS